jgi:hypothetical protein
VPQISTDTCREFTRMFICPGVCKTFFRYSSKIIMIDAAHVRTNFAGYNMSAVVMAGDGHPVIIAYAKMGSETQDFFEWFIYLLHINFPDISGFFSDDATVMKRLKDLGTKFLFINCAIHAGRNCGLNKFNPESKVRYIFTSYFHI